MNSVGRWLEANIELLGDRLYHRVDHAAASVLFRMMFGYRRPFGFRLLCVSNCRSPESVISYARMFLRERTPSPQAFVSLDQGFAPSLSVLIFIFLG